ncbi:efflux RND transporter periplasmic adaptor subunit [Denitratisoma oestradiolicum]|uniref:Efflux transporter periplasmic adaptor subunit n=1 Tax=Denitratisoma oestradiolicum TaxID=311182 RepID=A0A6S6XSS8_9PROT|nr:efflux RND transporter periplasmic adaptor subunit [Denitratisoma oestradiolicum]TWO82108.1 efflux transporter periplasmic adaptor subunit [Denitratisoma oestradiolicum]CAB1369038.1 Efflux transporter periplasmic adaptor subunit [Denitratisoma oestradiolicum]
MRQGSGVVLAAVVAVVAAGGGYWMGTRKGGDHGAAATSAQSAAAPTGESKARKLLYYRNPMGLLDTSPTPKKDPMGMDYVPVYEGEPDNEPAAANQIKISTDKVQKLGVRSETAKLRVLDRVVRAAGRIEPDERRIYAITPKFEGYVERLHVNVTGQPVGKGQPLFEVYSPELVSAQREYAIAAQGIDSLKEAGGEAQRGMRQLAESSLMRLKNWDISEEQLKALAKSGETKRTLTFRSPVAGVVTEKKALQGMRFMPGEALYQVADLSAVWVVADVFEQDIGLVKSGAKATVRINAYPDKAFTGAITYVYPTLNAETRTVPVRVEVANVGQLLKPGMFAQVELPVAAKGSVVTIPTSAVIDSGTRRIVLIQAGEGRFEPREVKLGTRSDTYVEVIDGVKDGEPVVVAANFLIDAESNLKAAVGGFGHASHGGGAAAPGQAAPAAPAAAVGSERREGAKSASADHRTEGKLDAIDLKAGTVTITHGPVATLKWPGMTMDFTLANSGLIGNLKPGASIEFTFIERKPGEWVIVKLAGTGAARPAAHAGH